MIMYYKLVKITINASSLAKIIINMIMRYYGLLDSIFTNQGLLFLSKFWLLLYYFLDNKLKLFTTFYLQMDG